MIKNQVKVFIHGLMDPYIKVNLSMIPCVDRHILNGLMDMFIKDNLYKINLLDMECTYGKLIASNKVNGSKTNKPSKVMAFNLMAMVVHTKDFLSMV